MQLPSIWQQVASNSTYLYALSAVMASALGWFIRHLVQQVSEALKHDHQMLKNVDDNLAMALTNHLPHLQAGVDQLGEKIDQTNSILLEQSGYLKSLTDILTKKV